MAFDLRPLTQTDLPRLRRFWKENWGDEFVVAHGVIYRPDGLDGFVALDGDEWVGEITYHMIGNDLLKPKLLLVFLVLFIVLS